ncbi:pilus assembly protein TadG-related protein [Streptomyces sp. YGL11-2]|uniref:pilus assembly protein TadG-related protein n=1 Tax=Streptomyces sp. YGL11-2 TaxID=3414028 RepID=UPI003CEEA75D
MPGTLTRRRRRDAGQTLPIYIVAIGGLLFLALAFFAVGQAAATRNGAQTAADAAALAAGQKYREELGTSFLDALRNSTGDPTAWQDLLNGRGAPSAAACRSADWYAGRNDAAVSSCTPDSWPTSFAVTVKTRNTVGRSVIPGTEDEHAAARAKAIVEPRCTLGAPTPPPGTLPAPTPTPTPTGDGKGTGSAPITLTCDGKGWTLDPAHLRALPAAADLFSVRLAQ